MKVVSIVGARPQFIKAGPISRLLRQEHAEVLVHTGQHYDDNMSDVFFEELEIPNPEYNLGVGSDTHGAQTAAMLSSIEQVLLTEQPDWVLVYGDTNSTLAGALAACKLHIRVAHVEAGLRSFNREMPEEINRVIADHVSNLLLCPSQKAIDNLTHEGITKGVHLVGDVMAEALAFAVEKARTRSDIIDRLDLQKKRYLLATVHRAENTDNSDRLRNVVKAFNSINEPIVFPAHPRTQKAIEALDLTISQNIRYIKPVGYLDMVRLEAGARMIMTDSGGVQKESYWLGVPCITLRKETEWTETVQTGWNQLVETDIDLIHQAINSHRIPESHPHLYGDGKTASMCIELLNLTEL